MIDHSKPLTEQTAADLRALLDALHGNRERYDRANRIVEARSCELEIAAATRALAIVNRRATEAEDERQDRTIARAELRDGLRALGVGMAGGFGDEVDAIADRIVSKIAGSPSQPALTADEVRALVREAAVALLDERKLYIVRPQQPTMNDIVLEAYGHGRACDAVALQGDDLHAVLSEIASRIAEKLAGRVVSAEQRESDCKPITAHEVHGLVADEFEVAITTRGFRGALGASYPEIRDSIAGQVAQRLVGRWIDVGKREADLREAFLRGGKWVAERVQVTDCGAGPSVDRPSLDDVEERAAEYARSKAGA